MSKTLIIGILVLLAVGGGLFLLNSFLYPEQGEDPMFAADYKNGWYAIDGEWIQLENGVHQEPTAENSVSVLTTRYFGNEARGDIDGDGDEDVAFLLTQDGGGSGIFYYLAGAIREDGGYRGTHAVLIGDRIAPQTTEFRDGRVIVNYADRLPGEAMASVPSVAKSLYLKYDPVSRTFGEIVADFEGEIDMNRFEYGQYGYRCGDGTEFTMWITSDMSKILLVPATSVDRLPRVILDSAESEHGVEFRSDADGIVFHAHGEEVELSTPAFETTCAPMFSADEAPFNFGD